MASTGRGSKRSRSHSPLPQSHEEPQIICAGCSLDLCNSAYASLQCDHKICFECFGAAQANRSADLKIKCPHRAPNDNCTCETDTWNIHTPATTRSRRDSSDGRSQRRHYVVSQTIVQPKADSYKNRHPVLYYAKQDDTYKKNYAILSMAIAQRGVDGRYKKTSLFTTELRRDGNIDGYGPDEVSSLEAIGQYLHSCLLPSSINSSGSTSEIFSPSGSVDSLEKTDESPLRKFLHAIATGEQYSSKNNKYSQKERNVTYAVADLMRTAKGGAVKSSQLKDLITNTLMTNGVPEALVNVLNSIGISKSSKCLSLSKDKAVEQKIKEGWDPRGRGYGVCIGAYDNIGFRQKKGYVQFTMICVMFVCVHELIKEKIYPDPKRTDRDAAIEDALSHERLDWSEEKDSFHFGITTEDGEILAKNVVLPYISFVLDAYNKAFPTLDQSKAVSSGTQINFQGRVPRSSAGRGVFQEVEEEDEPEPVGETNLAETTIGDEDIGDINGLDDNHQEDHQTILDANNGTLDLPMKEDLNAVKTIKALATLFTGLADKTLEQTTRYDGEKLIQAKLPEDDDDVDDDEPYLEGNPWLQNGWSEDQLPTPFSLGPYICGDGLPTFGLLRLKRTDPAYRTKKFTPFNGGFHTILELHKMRGKMFGESHLREIWKGWRPTKPQQDWVFCPGDPGQVEEELISYYYGMIAGAVDALLEERRADAGGSLEITAVDVYKFMKKAAQKSAIAQVIYNELRFAEVIFLIHRAEEESNAEMFVTAMKFACLLFTANHATKYTNIAAEFLMWWHCASPAEKKFFEKFILTRKTKSGKRIFTDRFVEWLIKDVRAGVGKHYRRGTDAALERQVALLNKQKRFEASLNSNDKHKGDDKTAHHIGKAFCCTYAYCVEKQIWGGRDGDTTSRVTMEAGGTPVNTEMINAPLTGEKRMDDYVRLKFIDTATNAAAREKEITALLKDIQPTVEMQRENDRKHLERSISTDVAYVEKNYDASELKSTHAYVESQWNPYEHEGHRLAKPPKKNCRKVFYAEIVCDARRRWIEKDPTWIQTEQARIRSLMEDRDRENASAIRGRLDEMLPSRFFNLIDNDNEILNRYSQKKYDLSTTNGDAGGGSDGNAAQVQSQSLMWSL